MFRRAAWMLPALLTASIVATAGPAAVSATGYVDPPALADRVKDGSLPPIDLRLPTSPRVMTLDGPGQEPGRHGGEITTLIRKEKDVKLICIYGYSRLVGFDRSLELVADILEHYEVEDGRIFTFHLRPGHKWSDGHPFTVEDFRFWWQDVALNADLNPSGPPGSMLVDGEPPTVEFIDDVTVRYSWSKPNPDFLARLAGAAPLFIYLPAHHMKQFHGAYADPAALADKVAAAGLKSWAELFDSRDNLYFSDDPELPTLQPWVNTTMPPTTRFVAVRNPYFHRVDPNGLQLPYADAMNLNVASSSLIPAKTAAGEADLQARGLNMSDYVVLREVEERGGYRTALWATTVGSQVALYFNLNNKDDVWRAVVRDVRFRRAMSLGVDRNEINQTMYFGIARPSADTVLPESPLYKPRYAKSWATFDPDRANALLDEIGLARGGDGLRRLPDGRPMEIVAETAGEHPEQVDVLQLIADHWQSLGVRLLTRPMQREVLRKRAAAGETLLSVWGGILNALPTADMSPQDLVPSSRYHFNWPDWGEYYEFGGEKGSKPDMPEVARLAELYQVWRGARTAEAKAGAWTEILDIRADGVFTIGTVNGVGHPVVTDLRLRNVPAEGVYNWDPGAFFGMYNPDTFWFAAK